MAIDGWRPWRRRRSAAEESLAALQPGARRRTSVRGVERLLSLPAAALVAGETVPSGTRFAMRVDTVSTGSAGVVLTGKVARGEVAPGVLVDVLALRTPDLDADLDPDLARPTRARRWQLAGELLAALRDAPSRPATVVTWDATSRTLVISGLTVDDVPIGCLVTA